MHRLLLAHYPPGEGLFHPQQLAALGGLGQDAGHQRRDLDAGAFADHLGDVPRGDRAAQPAALFLQLVGEQGQLFHRLVLPVAQDGGLLKILPQDGRLLLFAQLVQRLVDLLVGRVRAGGYLLGDLGGGLVHQVDGFVRQKAVGQIPPGKPHRGLYGLLGDLDAVVLLVAGEDAAQNLHALLVAGLLHQHALKAALQRTVLFDVAAVLGDGGGAHQLDLPAGELGLEDVGGVDRTLRRARADDVVNLVDKEDDVLGGSGFVHHVFDPLLKLAAVLGAGHHRD